MATSTVLKLNLNEVKPYWRNARMIDKVVPMVKESIKTYGYNQYIVIDEDNVIIAGHARYQALRELGYTEANFIRVEGLTPNQVKEYRIVDNKTAEQSKWLFAELSQEISTLNPELFKPYFLENELADLVSHIPKTISALSDKYVVTSTDRIISEENPVTEADITAAGNELDDLFQRIAEGKIKEYLEVVCPHCGETFNVRRADILRRPE